MIFGTFRERIQPENSLCNQFCIFLKIHHGMNGLVAKAGLFVDKEQSREPEFAKVLAPMILSISKKFRAHMMKSNAVSIFR